MRQPNVLFLITDQQQAATVAPGSPCRTPHLEQLSAEGTRFSRAYTVNAICSPTRASLFTGMLPHTHGMVDCTHTVEDYRARFRRGLTLWSQRLQEAGYRPHILESGMSNAHYGTLRFGPVGPDMG
ncbi:MAG: sulfatase-like hydrolase/transferase [Candidatus Poribacteria bacterium]|nr:sulfatase-like hydrolase/transferase [Candidatus Poribacteria bacterium]